MMMMMMMLLLLLLLLLMMMMMIMMIFTRSTNILTIIRGEIDKMSTSMLHVSHWTHAVHSGISATEPARCMVITRHTITYM